MNSRVIYHNGFFYNSPDYSKPEYSWILVQAGQVKDAGMEKPQLSGQKTVDLQRGHVYGAFCDNHLHLQETLFAKMFPNLDGVTELKHLIKELQEEMTQPATAEWIMAFNLADRFRHSPELLAELDRLRKPVILYFMDLHSGLLNKIALRKLDLPGKHGKILSGEDFYKLQQKFQEAFSFAELKPAYISFLNELRKKGILFINSLEGFPGCSKNYITSYQKLIKQCESCVQVLPMFQTFDGEKIMETGLKTIGGCILLDGSIGSHTAAIKSPYSDFAGSGSCYYKTNFLKKFIRNSTDGDLQTAFHAIGDRAVAQISKAYSSLDKKIVKKKRLRIEHAELIDNESLKRISQNGICLSVQPQFTELWGHPGGLYEKRLGSRRLKRMNNFKTLLKHGVYLAAGSDSPVTAIAPFQSIMACLFPPFPAQKLSLSQALKIHIETHHYFNFQENRFGRIKKGFRPAYNIFTAPIRLQKGGKIPELVGQITYRGLEVF
ncbi:amidohydrolase family protein [Candidatus Riflebacteria bacterium]